MGRLEGKVAIITGAAHGMGAVDAELFSREGARVVICDILDKEGAQVEARINESGGQALFVHMDVTRDDDWQRAVQATVERFGRVDILVNNAGISSTPATHEDSTEDWDRLLDINAKGVFLGAKWAVPEMRKAGGGAIVNISSIMGLVGLGVGHSGYVASKGAVRLLTKDLALKHGPDGIRANSIHPGFAPPMIGSKRGKDEDARRVADTPLGRLTAYEDVGNAVLFLASDDASFITGAELAVDGGYTAR